MQLCIFFLRLFPVIDEKGIVQYVKLTTFAAIDIGAYEIALKIFELSSRNGIREIDFVRQSIELGVDTYGSGSLSFDTVRKLCRTLREFKSIMDGYQVEAYRACAKSALRETSNLLFILEQIRDQTGLEVEVLSNSEHRFLSYKSVAYQENDFVKIIEKPTAIVDVGDGSVQISLFDKECLVTTQNIRIGSMRIRELLSAFEDRAPDLGKMIEELVAGEFSAFRRLHLKERETKNLILIGNFLPNMLRTASDEDTGYIARERLDSCFAKWREKSPEELVEIFSLPAENAMLILQSMILYQRIIQEMNPDNIWAPALFVCDGLAYDFAERAKVIKKTHNFENDILAAVKTIAKRYQCNKNHYQMVGQLAIQIFDGVRKVHGMDKRHRLLLQLAVMLHSCGYYISFLNSSECAYNIVMSTEVIGLSHMEREIVANTVRYNTEDFPSYEYFADRLEKEQYLIIAKLASILRLADALDSSHRQKCFAMKTAFRDGDTLALTLSSAEDMTLELGMAQSRKRFFEDVFGISVLLKYKKVVREK